MAKRYRARMHDATCTRLDLRSTKHETQGWWT